jgi:hypothetical protein
VEAAATVGRGPIADRAGIGRAAAVAAIVVRAGTVPAAVGIEVRAETVRAETAAGIAGNVAAGSIAGGRSKVRRRSSWRS